MNKIYSENFFHISQIMKAIHQIFPIKGGGGMFAFNDVLPTSLNKYKSLHFMELWPVVNKYSYDLSLYFCFWCICLQHEGSTALL